MIGVVVTGFLFGLSGAPHCIAMCGPLAVLCGRDRLPYWQVGRATSYVAIGLVGGTVGLLIPGPDWIPLAVGISLVILFAASLSGLIPEPRQLGLVRRLGAQSLGKSGPLSGFLFGVANGLIPCALVYAAVGVAVGLGSSLLGAVLMLSFASGTAVSFALLSRLPHAWISQHRLARPVIAAVAVAMSLYVLSHRQFGSPEMHQTYGSPAATE